MSFKKVFVWLEVWEHPDVASEASPGELEDCEGEVLHNIKSWTDKIVSILHKQWSDSFFCEECTLLHRDNASTIRRAAFWENQEGRVLAGLLDEFLSVADGHERPRFTLWIAAPRNVNAINNIRQRTKQRNIPEFFTWSKCWSNILNKHNWIKPAYMITDNRRRPLNFLHVGFVIWAQVVAVVDVFVIERSPHAANKKIK